MKRAANSTNTGKVETEMIFTINFILDEGQRPVIKSVTWHQVWTESLGAMVSRGKVK